MLMAVSGDLDKSYVVKMVLGDCQIIKGPKGAVRLVLGQQNLGYVNGCFWFP